MGQGPARCPRAGQAVPAQVKQAQNEHWTPWQPVATCSDVGPDGGHAGGDSSVCEGLGLRILWRLYLVLKSCGRVRHCPLPCLSWAVKSFLGFTLSLCPEARTFWSLRGVKSSPGWVKMAPRGCQPLPWPPQGPLGQNMPARSPLHSNVLASPKVVCVELALAPRPSAFHPSPQPEHCPGCRSVPGLGVCVCMCLSVF